MYSGILIKVDGTALDLNTINKENELEINIKNKVELFLDDGATLLDDKIELLENNSDVKITFMDSEGTEVSVVLKSLFDLLLTNDGETPILEVFKTGTTSDDVLLSFASVDELEAAAAGGGTSSDDATTDIILPDTISSDDPDINRLEILSSEPLRENEITPNLSKAFTFTGDLSGDAVEDTSDASGKVNALDSNLNNSEILASSVVGIYGTFNIDSSGNWTYDLNNADNIVQSLANGQNVNESFSFQVANTEISETIFLTITGTNDAPVITQGPDADSLLETNSSLITSGTLTVSDVDTIDTVNAIVDTVSVGGTGTSENTNVELLAMLGVSPAAILDNTQTSESLAWSFNSGNEAFNYLAKDQTLILEYTIKVIDNNSANDTETVTLTITGSNDLATITSSNSEDTTVVEAGYANDHTTVIGDPSAGGQLSVADVDDGEDKFQDPGSLVKTYGTFTFNTTTGVWGYTLNDLSTATQELNAGDNVSDTLTVTSFDGSDSQVITVNITGSNDLATITSSNSEDTTVIWLP